MQIHNYLRPLWRNGPHAVEDASPRVHTAFEMLFRSGRPAGRRTDELVQLHRVGPLDVAVAWISAEIDIPVAGTGFSYRRARYLHAFAIEGDAGRELTPRRARAHFEDVYGEDLLAGIRAAEEVLIALEHPAEHEAVRSWFVTGSRRAPRRESVFAAPARGHEAVPAARPVAHATVVHSPVPTEWLRPGERAIRLSPASERVIARAPMLAPALVSEPVREVDAVREIPPLTEPAVAEDDFALPFVDDVPLPPAHDLDLSAPDAVGPTASDHLAQPATDMDPHAIVGDTAFAAADDTVTVPSIEPSSSASLSVLLRARLSRPAGAAASTAGRAGEGAARV